MKALTYNQYRILNIIMLSVVFSIAEFAITIGANFKYRELPYTLSLAVIFISLELMRWKSGAVVSMLLSGLIFCFASGANAEQYLIYCIGNLAALSVLPILKALGSEKVRKDKLLAAAYTVLVFIAVQLGRWIVTLILGYSPLMIVQFFTTDALSGIFGVIVIVILTNVDGLFEDQKHYLLRLEEERKANEQ